MPKQDLKKVADRIGGRNWEEIKKLWIEHLPRVVFPTRSQIMPTSDLTRLSEIQSEIEEKEAASTTKHHYYSVPGLHPLVFSESIFLLYKALHVIRSSQCDIGFGYKTWSVSSSYQAGFFCAKSLLNLLGVHTVKTMNNKELLVDLFPEFRGISKREFTARRLASECQIQPVWRFDHWALWQLFQRVITILRCDLISPGLLTFLKSLDPKDFATQRNTAHYHNHSWLFLDLLDPVIDPSFSTRKIDFEDDIASADDFSHVLAYSLINITRSLLSDLAKDVPKLEEELLDVQRIVQHDHNAYFNAFLVENSL